MTTFMRAKFKGFVNDCTIPFESEYNLNERTSTYGGRVLFPGRKLRILLLFVIHKKSAAICVFLRPKPFCSQRNLSPFAGVFPS